MTEMPIYISVLVPVYGVEKYIERCARSIFEQSYPYLECIFVNDATKDRSMESLQRVIDMYPLRKDQVKIINHARNLGLAKARETAVHHASAEYVFHLDSDDYLERNCIATLVAYISQDKPCDLVVGAHRSIYENRTTIWKYPQIAREELLPQMLMRTTFYHIWNMLIRRTLYEGLEIPAINNGEDYITTCRLFYRARSLAIADQVTYNYTHDNRSSFQHQGTSEKNIDELEQSSLYLQNYFIGNEYLKDFLNVGQLMAYAMILYNCSLSQMKELTIPAQLTTLLRDKRLGKMRLLLQLHRFHCYLPILLISRFHKRFIAG
jgi:glycosyltransferase involved in cell wall biosynthesis